MTKRHALSAGAFVPRLGHIDAVRRIVDSKRQDPFFKRRYEHNVSNPPSRFSRHQFWHWMIVCICTSVQRSGPNSRVSQFEREAPFPLSLAACVGQENLRQFAEAVLRSRGLRFGPKLAVQIETNMRWLTNGGWATVKEQFDSLASGVLKIASPPQRIAAERAAARTVMGRNGGLAGFGPKQARNLWQCLGVTQYEIPLDSRISNWLKALPGGFEIEPSRLYASAPYYEAMMSRIQALCAAAGVLPCEFDAAAFSSTDDGAWPEVDSVL
jgi:hypothetical protein